MEVKIGAHLPVMTESLNINHGKYHCQNNLSN
ncbi:unnamed protein product [Blumeria hordei]|uniref:Uncharacterized protein n=1 Tax=Blumeria hordei TaxID=2867405 RepID=A0A383UR47_BLUHO|nr:unnamed protein product [Blumeria hordei]